MDRIKEVEADLVELKQLSSEAKRSRTKDLLSLEIRRVETELQNLQLQARAEETPSGPKNNVNRCYDVNLRDYAWDQSDKFVKLYVTMKNVHNHDKEKVKCNFMDRSVNLRVSELDNKNFILSINNLLDYIKPESSHFKIKTDMVVVFMAKDTVAKTWDCVTGADKKTKDARKPKLDQGQGQPGGQPGGQGGEADMGGGLMDMMKQMYEDGDSEMKQMLNKTMYENQQKQMRGETDEMGAMGGMGGMGGMGALAGMGGMGGMGGGMGGMGGGMGGMGGGMGMPGM